jgi:small subunit ribosomal protein S21
MGVFNILMVLFQVKIAKGQRKVKKMSIVRVGENENIDSALRRFKRKCSRDGIIGDLRKKEFYESPSIKRKKKAEAARKRSIKG